MHVWICNSDGETAELQDIIVSFEWSVLLHRVCKMCDSKGRKLLRIQIKRLPLFSYFFLKDFSSMSLLNGLYVEIYQKCVTDLPKQLESMFSSTFLNEPGISASVFHRFVLYILPHSTSYVTSGEQNAQWWQECTMLRMTEPHCKFIDCVHDHNHYS